LKDAEDDLVASVYTNALGFYSFEDILIGNYTVSQTNLEGYRDVSDQDERPDGDIFDDDTTVDNSIGVTLEAGEIDEGNDLLT
jgi:hypothetical protein